MRMDFGLSVWGDGDFVIDGDDVRLAHASRPSLLEITEDIRHRGYKGPILLRFPHLIKKQIDSLFAVFAEARSEFGYSGRFHALFPLKVNQYPNLINHLLSVSSHHSYGLEAGSKAELVIAMSKTPLGSPITVNGFKDKEMISLVYIAAKSGHNITVTIEGLAELETIIEVDREFNAHSQNPIAPHIGMRVRLHSTGVGVWAKSGGYGSKFGLTSTELLEAYDVLDRSELLDRFSMIHFHIGSQMSEINPLKKALREAGHIYAHLKQKGATGLTAINIGGGLAVEYAQHNSSSDRNYSLKEFANDVVFLMQEIARQKGVQEPDIYTESGRFIAASHAVLIAPVLELFSQEYHESGLKLKETNPPLIQELYELHSSISKSSAREYLHDALDHMESLLTLFDLGYIDLEDRSNTEILVNLIIKKAINLLQNEDSDELDRLQNRIQERYLVNFSSFQSLPDFWGLGQSFPVMPISHLSQKPTRPASIWDITCDSDGEITFDPMAPLYLHDVDIAKEEYFLAFFLTGAYQEVLGMSHNLFTHPTECVVTFDADGSYRLSDMVDAKNLMSVLGGLGYDLDELDRSLKKTIEESTILDAKEKQDILGKLYLYLSENSYLKTIQAIIAPK